MTRATPLGGDFGSSAWSYYMYTALKPIWVAMWENTLQCILLFTQTFRTLEKGHYPDIHILVPATSVITLALGFSQ